MKVSKVEYYLVVVIMIASLITAVLSNFNSKLFSTNSKLIFKAGLVIGFVWLVTRGKNYNKK